MRVDDDGLIRGELEMGNHPDAAWIEKDIRGGIRQKVSIAYDPGETFDVTASKEKGGIPTRTYRDWLLYEGSTVSIPADYNVGIGRAQDGDRPARNGREELQRAVAEALESALKRKAEFKDSTDSATGSAASDEGNGAPVTEEVAMATENTAGAAPAADAERAAMREAEKKRAKTLRSLARMHGLDERGDHWVAEGTSVEDALEEVRAAQAAGETGSADSFVRSPAGPTQRNGELKRFDSFGEQMMAVVRASIPGGHTDPRLRGLFERAGTGLSEGTAQDGGFAVQTDFLPDLLTPMWDSGAIASRVRRIPVSGNANGLKVNLVDESSRADGSRWGGIQGYWAAEADAYTASKPKMRQAEWDLKKLIAACYLTDELMEDAAALAGTVTVGFQEEMVFKLEDAILNGDGAGKPLGILRGGLIASSPWVTSTAIEATQTIANTATFIAANAAKMKTRIQPRNWNGVVWLINPDIEAKLLTAVLANAPVYLPPGGISAAPYGTLLGKPVIPTEYNPAEGTPGDFMAADLSQYVCIEKGGVKTASSVHVRFLNDEQVLKFTYRVDGQPLPATAVTPFKGSSTKSPFAALAVRS